MRRDRRGLTVPRGLMGQVRLHARVIPIWLVGVIALGVWLTAGCATKGELEEIKKEIRASAARVEVFRGETQTDIEATEKQIDEKLAELQRSLHAQADAIEEKLRQLTQELTTQAVALAGLVEDVKDKLVREDTLAREMAELGVAVHRVSQSLRRFLQTQEAQLKDTLRQVQSALKDVVGEEKPSQEEPK